MVSGSAHAADISWSGLYRVEGFQGSDLELDGNRKRDAYLLQHFVLSPKIVASDGLNIYGRFDIMNNCGFGQGNQAGQLFGDGPHNSATCGVAPSTTNYNSNVFATAQNPELISLTQLYATWVHEFGVLVVGRAPLQFGLGVTYNAGNGLFDHWYTTEDIVGYKIVMGNLFVMPMIGKVDSGPLDSEHGVDDYMLHVEYDNPETDLSLGAFYQLRVATTSGTDSPSNSDDLGGAGSSVTEGFKRQSVNFYVNEKVHDINVGVEAGMISGQTGVTMADGSGVGINAFGVAAEVSYKDPAASLLPVLKMGIASGDDPGTLNSYEGFIFNRNYDVAMLLFNHPLGQGNFFRTGLVRDVTANASSQIDDEAISNAFYLAPSLQYKIRESMSIGGSFIYARLLQDPFYVNGTSAGTDRNLGFETDFNFTYKPYERMTWISEAGLLIPGAAWKGGSQGYSNKFAYGLSTKAAISF